MNWLFPVQPGSRHHYCENAIPFRLTVLPWIGGIMTTGTAYRKNLFTPGQIRNNPYRITDRCIGYPWPIGYDRQGFFLTSDEHERVSDQNKNNFHGKGKLTQPSDQKSRQELN